MKKHWLSFQNIAIFLIFGWLTLFVFAPNLLIFITSFLQRDANNFVSWTFSLDNYLRLFDSSYASIVLHSFKLATITTAICLLFGYPFAFFLTKVSPQWRPYLLFLTVLPFWTNSLIRIYGIKIFLGTRGILNEFLLWIGLIETPLKILNTPIAVVIGLVSILLPFMILPLYSSIEKLDKNLLEAAKDLGANRFQTFIRVIIPLTMPGIIAGSVLVLLPAMGMFYVADILGGSNTVLVGNLIKSQFSTARDWPFGAAISISLSLLTAILLAMYYYTAKFMNKKGDLE